MGSAAASSSASSSSRFHRFPRFFPFFPFVALSSPSAFFRASSSRADRVSVLARSATSALPSSSIPCTAAITALAAASPSHVMNEYPMFLPPRRGRRRPVTPGISSTSQRTSALLSALGMLLRYTVEGAPRGGSSLVETSPFGSRGDDDGGGGDDDDGVIFGEAKARSQLAVSPARAPPSSPPATTRSTRPMAPSTSRTLMPCGWCFELVRNSRTTPRVSLPVPWSAFNTMSTSAPTEMSARLRPSGSPGRTCAKRSSVDEHVTVNERRARDGASHPPIPTPRHA